jgi:acyl dehydratase
MSIELVRVQLDAQVGQDRLVTDWVSLEQPRIDLFAEATGDRQWIHVDVERAERESPLGAPVARGFLTLSLLPMLTSAGIEAESNLPGVSLCVNSGLNRVRFPAQVRAGARVRARSTVREVTDVPGGLQVVRVVTVESEGSDKPACVAETVSRPYFE